MMETQGEMKEAARVDPFTLVFAHPLFLEELFPGIHEEAVARGVRTAHPETFVRLQAVGDVLDRLVPPDPAGVTGAAAAELAEHGRLLYQAYHYWCYGGRVYPMDGERARSLLAGTTPRGDAPLRVPAPAGYVQLPANLVWARIDESLPAEPADGFFWTMAGIDSAETPPYDRLDVLLALGVRPGRAGFSIVAAGATLPDGGGVPWEAEPARSMGQDFENVLPGGELGGLFSVTTSGEALKLASRWFRQHAAVDG
jgi:hypothetical protein